MLGPVAHAAGLGGLVAGGERPGAEVQLHVVPLVRVQVLPEGQTHNNLFSHTRKQLQDKRLNIKAFKLGQDEKQSEHFWHRLPSTK